MIGQHAEIFVGMVGICGGRKAGSVIVAEKAFDPMCGAYIWNKESAQYYLAYDGTRSPPESFELLSRSTDLVRNFMQATKFEADFGFCASLGTLYSTSNVRNDACVLLDSTSDPWPHVAKAPENWNYGIDMEAFAFYHTIRIILARDRRVFALPVIKGISDVGTELLGEERLSRPVDDAWRLHNRGTNIGQQYRSSQVCCPFRNQRAPG
jgi:hypothetical protein